MTIHRRRGSGYAHYWLAIAVGAVGVVLAIVLAVDGRLAFDGTRAAMSVTGVLAVLGVLWLLNRR